MSIKMRIKIPSTESLNQIDRGERITHILLSVLAKWLLSQVSAFVFTVMREAQKSCELNIQIFFEAILSQVTRQSNTLMNIN